MYKNEKRYALVNGVLLDGTRDMAPQTGKVICVDGSRIAAVTDGAAPAGYEPVDLGGQYVLPGLINLHVHLPASGKPKKKPSDPKKLVKLIGAGISHGHRQGGLQPFLPGKLPLEQGE